MFDVGAAVVVFLGVAVVVVVVVGAAVDVGAAVGVAVGLNVGAVVGAAVGALVGGVGGGAGHAIVLHGLDALPSHASPPLNGAGLVHVRDCSPPPQDLEQAPKVAHPPATALRPVVEQSPAKVRVLLALLGMI